jgi:hypothetical protein
MVESAPETQRVLWGKIDMRSLSGTKTSGRRARVVQCVRKWALGLVQVDLPVLPVGEIVDTLDTYVSTWTVPSAHSHGPARCLPSRTPQLVTWADKMLKHHRCHVSHGTFVV